MLRVARHFQVCNNYLCEVSECSVRSAMPPKIRPEEGRSSGGGSCSCGANEPDHSAARRRAGFAERRLHHKADRTWTLVCPTIPTLTTSSKRFRWAWPRVAHKSPTQTICLRWAAHGNSHPKQGLLAQLTLLGWTSSGQPFRVFQCAWLL